MNHRLPGDRNARVLPPPRLRGVALVITLIMLSIITVLTVTILSIASRDRNAVGQAANLTTARLAAESGLDRAKGEMIAQIIHTRSMMGYDLTVSRSVSNALDLLLVDPRVPAFPPNLLPDELVEGRYFLDGNRNGRFEATYLGYPGDPQWIGQLAKPDQPHGPNNRFEGRFCFFVVPAGKTLDVNFLHNAASARQVAGIGGDFFRNQGFGPWEINLGGFLADLTPAVWTYTYDGFPLPAPTGTAFEDAKSLLMYRYTGSFYNLSNIFSLYNQPAVNAFTTDFIDNYAHAPGAMGVTWPTGEPETIALARTFPWPGAESPRSFFTPSEFFDPAKTSPVFANRLAQAGASTNDFERYTYYRMLAQLGTDSAAAADDRIHVNYVNRPVDPATLTKIQAAGYPVTSTNLSATNFVPWDLPGVPELAVCFFTNVAERLFQQQFEQFNTEARAGITNIPNVLMVQIAPSNYYSPALHRLYQTAANIFDATRTNIFPSVFRPQFTSNASGVFLTGFDSDNKRSTLPAWLTANRQYGVPLVIGAKKGFPNFNEFTLRTDFQVTRKLEFVRPDTNSAPNLTNQMYILGISNLFAVESWNSYAAQYPRPLALEVANEALVRMTNDAGLNWTMPLTYAGSFSNLPANFWGGGEFKLPLYQQEVLIPPSRYLFMPRTFEPVGTNYYFTEPQTLIGFPFPDWNFSISNRFLYVLTDTSSDSIVDFVLSSALNSSGNIDQMLRSTHQRIGTTEEPIVTSLWDTNRADGSQSVWAPTVGIVKQIDVSAGDEAVSVATWKNYVNENARGMDKEKAIVSFRKFMDPNAGVWGPYASNLAYTTSLRMQAPFNPTRKLVQTTTWQADDPLVHYHDADLLIFPTNSIFEPIVPPTTPVPTNMTLATIGHLNNRYAPWGGNPEKVDPLNPSADFNAYNAAIKDPGVRISDDWDFPHSKFANVGWLGRVHRGTPWQSIYFKPDVAPQETWRLQSADYLWYPPQGDQAHRYVRTHPTNDWALAEMFTIATDANATRGLLSINQTNLAAWSGVFAGAVLLRNPLSDKDVLDVAKMTNNAIPLQEIIVQPVAVDTNVPPPLLTLVNAINDYRRTLPNGAFTSLSQLLQVPEFTINSPWLNTANDPQSGKPLQRMLALSDTAYERIPQQILSLLKSGDSRFIIYAYGQALKPADGSILTADTTINGRLIPQRTCTNYQVSAEQAVRAVIRVEGTPQNPRTIVESFNLLPPE